MASSLSLLIPVTRTKIRPQIESPFIIWFDQEGFREIAPVFTFSYYNREDDLLYFTTEQVGYPFHYDSMQQVPVLRKVFAPDYEEAYVLLEGKSQRNAAGRRDFIS
ncbi:hypothetical protein PtB15_14B105 [Puccinia triticina]|nr:hypothetical protein PtB15_14B105 [Puccinia triticina]